MLSGEAEWRRAEGGFLAPLQPELFRKKKRNNSTEYSLGDLGALCRITQLSESLENKIRASRKHSIHCTMGNTSNSVIANSSSRIIRSRATPQKASSSATGLS